MHSTATWIGCMPSASPSKPPWPSASELCLVWTKRCFSTTSPPLTLKAAHWPTPRPSAATRATTARIASSAQRCAGGLDAAALERYLTSLDVPQGARPDGQPGHATIESLSPERRALLLERLRKRKVAG